MFKQSMLHTSTVFNHTGECLCWWLRHRDAMHVVRTRDSKCSLQRRSARRSSQEMSWNWTCKLKQFNNLILANTGGGWWWLVGHKPPHTTAWGSGLMFICLLIVTMLDCWCGDALGEVAREAWGGREEGSRGIPTLKLKSPRGNEKKLSYLRFIWKCIYMCVFLNTLGR